jgi:5,10-methylene-tetrahydrofolate dehydrogenase/methenyl tetrahydrofolate cyclohydrolase
LLAFLLRLIRLFGTLVDQPGVEIGVEEAILEANDEEGVDGIMVSIPFWLLSKLK